MQKINLPEKFVVGDTVIWDEKTFLTPDKREISPAQGWVATYSFRSHGIDSVGVSYQGGWRFTLSTTNTTTLGEGTHAWHFYASKASERFTIGYGTIEAAANIGGSVGHQDARTQAEIDLAAVEAEIRARIGGGATIEYSVGTRSLKKEPMSELIILRNMLRADVAREKAALKIAQGLGNPRKLNVRFV